jgi:hypothetical protein
MHYIVYIKSRIYQFAGVTVKYDVKQLLNFVLFYRKVSPFS